MVLTFRKNELKYESIGCGWGKYGIIETPLNDEHLFGFSCNFKYEE